MDGSASSERFFVRRSGGRQLGPMGKLAILHMAKSGMLSRDDMLAKEGTDRWVKASSIPGLFDDVGKLPTVRKEAIQVTPPEVQAGVSQEVTIESEDIPQVAVEPSPEFPKWVIAVGCTLALIVIFITASWYVASQHMQQGRLRNTQELLTAIENMENRATDVSNEEVARLWEAVDTLATKHRKLVDSSLADRISSFEKIGRTAFVDVLFVRYEVAVGEAANATTIADIRAKLTEANAVLKQLNECLAAVYPEGIPQQPAERLNTISTQVAAANSKAASIEAEQRARAEAEAAERARLAEEARLKEKYRRDYARFREFFDCFNACNSRWISEHGDSDTFILRDTSFDVSYPTSMSDTTVGTITGRFSEIDFGTYIVEVTFRPMGSRSWVADDVTARWSGIPARFPPDTSFALKMWSGYVDLLRLPAHCP